MTVLWTADDAAKAAGGKAQGNWTATGVSIDTRTLVPGDLFVALKDSRDGHDFVATALDKGAAAAMVSRIPSGLAADAPLLLVDDVLAALERLGRAARHRTGARVIAVTGSAGKTSTKDMLRHVLKGQGRTHAAEASYNNHWGVPLTLARMPVDTEFAIVEIGMNHPGEIAPLSRLARPHIAIVTTVAAAHLEAFASVEDIAREKASIFQGLERNGLAIFNADLDTSDVLAEIAPDGAISFGMSEGALVRATNIELRDTVTIVEGRVSGGLHAQPGEKRQEVSAFVFKVGAPGRHFAMNALAVLAAVDAAGGDWDLAASDLAYWHPPAGRGLRERLVLDEVEGLGVELLDDAFNANPASMAAAFDVLVNVPVSDGVGRIEKGRRIAILGDMLELGRDEAALHEALADHPAMAGIDQVHCVGSRMKALYDVLPADKRGRHTATAEDLAAQAHKLIDAGDVVLVKGSKGSRVSLVVAALKKLAKASEHDQMEGSE